MTSSWVMRKSDFCMGNVEIWFLVTRAIWRFHKFLKGIEIYQWPLLRFIQEYRFRNIWLKKFVDSYLEKKSLKHVVSSTFDLFKLTDNCSNIAWLNEFLITVNSEVSKNNFGEKLGSPFGTFHCNKTFMPPNHAIFQ